MCWLFYVLSQSRTLSRRYNVLMTKSERNISAVWLQSHFHLVAFSTESTCQHFRKCTFLVFCFVNNNNNTPNVHIQQQVVGYQRMIKWFVLGFFFFPTTIEYWWFPTMICNYHFWQWFLLIISNDDLNLLFPTSSTQNASSLIWPLFWGLSIAGLTKWLLSGEIGSFVSFGRPFQSVRMMQKCSWWSWGMISPTP